jgi:hypothetical protein
MAEDRSLATTAAKKVLATNPQWTASCHNLIEAIQLGQTEKALAQAASVLKPQGGLAKAKERIDKRVDEVEEIMVDDKGEIIVDEKGQPKKVKRTITGYDGQATITRAFETSAQRTREKQPPKQQRRRNP